MRGLFAVIHVRQPVTFPRVHASMRADCGQQMVPGLLRWCRLHMQLSVVFADMCTLMTVSGLRQHLSRGHKVTAQAVQEWPLAVCAGKCD
jgi:hypothetical protein